MNKGGCLRSDKRPWKDQNILKVRHKPSISALLLVVFFFQDIVVKRTSVTFFLRFKVSTPLNVAFAMHVDGSKW